MSPEQALGKRVVIDHQTDVYSLGATFYELLTLRPAFAGTDRQELLRQIAFEEPAAPRRLDRAVPADLETVVRKAMEKAPQDRYTTAQELADDLRRWLDDRPIQARRPSVVQQLRKWARRHQAAVLAAGVCLLVTLAAVAGSVGWVVRDRAARATRAETQGRDLLQEVDTLRQQGKWPDALSLVRRAEELLASAGGGGAALRWRAQELQRDLNMAARLEEIRLRISDTKELHFDQARTNRLYQQAFQDYGLDVLGGDPARTGEQIRSTSIAPQLVAALDDWALMRLEVRGKEDPQWRNLLALARSADPDDRRGRLREAVEQGTTDTLEHLAHSVEVSELSPATVLLLSVALKTAGRAEPATAMLRQAQRRHPGDFWIHVRLGLLLHGQALRRPGEEIRCFAAALAIRPENPLVYGNLGVALAAEGQLDEAIAVFREALRLQPGLVEAQNNIGSALHDQGRRDEAMAQWRQAIRVNRDFPGSHFNLGNALRDQGQFAEAAAEYREALRVKNDYAMAHLNLGGVLAALGRFDEAVSEIREALRIKNDFPEAQTGLAQALQQKAAMEKLPRVLMGEIQPADAAERVVLAVICQAPFQRRYAASARLYREAFAQSATLADELSTGHRYNASCAAALAGCGEGKDGVGQGPMQRLRWRRQALTWLHADLRAWQRLLAREPVTARSAVAQTMARWLADTDFNGVRGADALARLPAEERAAWARLWADVADLLARTKEPKPNDKEKPNKP
jgi:serine/threonine-protein kinase